MTSTARASSTSYVVDEPLLRTIAAEIQAAIPGAEVCLFFGSRARYTERPDSDLDLFGVTPIQWTGVRASRCLVYADR